MNCQLCQKELEEYREGRLPEGIRAQVEMHLSDCENCTEIYNLESIAFKVMDREKEIQTNPFLATRILAQIDELELKNAKVQNIRVLQRILKPALIGVSLSAALFTGIMMGNIYNSGEIQKTVPVEMVYMDDATIESVNVFSNE